MRKNLSLVIRVIVGSYFAALLYLYSFQTSLVFQSQATPYTSDVAVEALGFKKTFR